jgi:HB1, ASXL, restriction endonuclease HTH domain
MLLHEAIEKVLTTKGRPLTARQIAEELNKNKWYTKKDKSPIAPAQITARVKNYPAYFKTNRSVSPHLIDKANRLPIDKS